jgi:hypothetical protein
VLVLPADAARLSTRVSVSSRRCKAEHPSWCFWQTLYGRGQRPHLTSVTRMSTIFVFPAGAARLRSALVLPALWLGSRNWCWCCFNYQWMPGGVVGQSSAAASSTAACETSFKIDFLASFKNRVGNRVAHEPLLLNRELLNNHHS